MVLGPIHSRLHFGHGKRAARVVDEVPLDRRVHRGRTVLERDDVLRASDDHSGARLAEQPQRDLVGHRARGHEQSGGLPEPRREGLLERYHGRVFTRAVVAHLGFSHRPTHRG